MDMSDMSDLVSLVTFRATITETSMQQTCHFNELFYGFYCKSVLDTATLKTVHTVP